MASQPLSKNEPNEYSKMTDKQFEKACTEDKAREADRLFVENMKLKERIKKLRERMKVRK